MNFINLIKTSSKNVAILNERGKTDLIEACLLLSLTFALNELNRLPQPVPP